MSDDTGAPKDDDAKVENAEPLEHPAVSKPKTGQVGRNGKKLVSKKLALAGGGVVVLVVLVVVVLSATGGSKKGDDTKRDMAQKQHATMQFNYGNCMSEQSKAGKTVTEQGEICQDMQRKYNLEHGIKNDDTASGDLGDPNATDPLARGKALGYGQCTGSGSAKLTHAPMDTKDVGTIQPMGLTAAAHVTPVDHEYYYQKNPNAPANTYAVYAVMDGVITGAGHVGNAWAVFLSHSCTFYADYNLMTDLSDSVKSKLPAGWGPNSNGNVKIPVKSGQVIGYVGGQSLDFAVWDTTKTLKNLLVPVAYNNAEPWKLNTVHPLDYFTDAVKKDVLTKYVRTAEPRDGRIDYDVDGQGVGNWFAVGTNGYGGGDRGTSDPNYPRGHLSLTYDYIDSKVPLATTRAHPCNLQWLVLWIGPKSRHPAVSQK
jgi:hypothetical protein